MTLSAIYEDLWRIITMILYLFRIPIKFFNLAEFELKNQLAAGNPDQKNHCRRSATVP